MNVRGSDETDVRYIIKQTNMPYHRKIVLIDDSKAQTRSERKIRGHAKSRYVAFCKGETSFE